MNMVARKTVIVVTCCAILPTASGCVFGLEAVAAGVLATYLWGSQRTIRRRISVESSRLG